MRNYIKLVYTILLPVIMLLFLGCNKHYGPLSKVRVLKQEKIKTPTQPVNDNVTNNTTIETNKDEQVNNITANADTLAGFITKNEYSFNIQSKSKTKLGSSQEKIKHVKSKKALPPKKPPFNYYSKWAFLLSLLGVLLFVPGVLAPLALFMAIKSLKEIKKNGERGKVAAIVAIVIGAILTIVIAGIVLEILLTDFDTMVWVILVAILCLLVLLLNLLVYNTIKKSARNPANADSPERPFKKQKFGLKLLLIFLLTLIIVVNLIVLIFLRGAAAG